MTFQIKHGATSLTGAYLPNYWTLHVTGKASEKHRKLSDAKQSAVRHGASGKWKREARPTGIRGRMETVYVELKGGGT